MNADQQMTFDVAVHAADQAMQSLVRTIEALPLEHRLATLLTALGMVEVKSRSVREGLGISPSATAILDKMVDEERGNLASRLAKVTA